MIPRIINPDLAGSHESIVGEIGTKTWLRRLLVVLEGDYATNADDPTIADGYTRDN